MTNVRLGRCIALFSLLFIGAFSAACSDDGELGCVSDDECKGERICDDGSCAFLDDRETSDDDEDLCADVDCDFGECDPETGICLNESECRTDDECLPGYECGEDYICEPVYECIRDADCEAGICVDGVCVNPDACETDDDCLERTFCGPDGTCEPDPCNAINCQRGVCERGTGTCVSAKSCTEETEHVDCLAGEKCAAGTCQPPQTFCDEVECERGVCSFEEGGCANASTCEGDDDLCLEGYVCNSANRCEPEGG